MSVDDKQWHSTVHSIVASAFLGHNPKERLLVVDHINGVKHDNRLSNLRLITQRKNTIYGYANRGTKSNVTGAFKIRNKWTVYIKKDGKRIFIGSFDDKNEAGKWYSDALYAIENNLPINVKKAIYASNYNGVTWSKCCKKWIARKVVDGRRKHLGLFMTEEDAYNAIISYRKSY